MNYYIKVNESMVPVSEEVYKAYCKGERKERYFRESDIRNRTFFYDALDTEDQNGSELFQDPMAKSVEDMAECQWFLERMKKGVKELTKSEQELLCRLYVYGDSLHKLSKSTGTPVTTLQARHQRILKKLRKFLKI